MKKITFLIVLIALCFSWNAVAQITSYPYSEDFESSDGGWVATNGSNGTWALGTPSANVINSAASGTKAWATNLSGNYNANENSFVKSPVFDFSTLTAPGIEFSIWWNSEFSWDGAVLQSSIDNGTTWQNVGGLNDPNNWYNDNSIAGNPGGQQVGWTGRNSSSNGSNGWQIARHALTGLAGQSNVVFRFAFGSEGSVQDNGVAFDLVSIFEVSCPEPVNLLVNNIDGTDVNISWTPGGSQTEFEFLNLPQGSPAPTNADSGTSIPTSFATIMNLTVGQNYQFYVRTVCVNDEFSSWAGPLNYAISSPGETCLNPLIVSTPLPYVTSDNTANYLDDYNGTPGSSCGSTFSYLNGDDVVYAYTPDADTSIDILLSNISDNYAGIFVYDSCTNIGVSCLTGATNGFSQTDLFIDNFGVTAGQTYYIVISTWASPQSTEYTLTITENTCIDPVVTYNVVGDCQVAPQFYVEVDLTSLGSADTITLTDNQGSAVQTATATGLFTFGPYANTTNVIITTVNADDANCTLTSQALTQPFCQDFVVDCVAGASTLNYCYDNNGATTPVIFTFTSNDGNSLNLTFDAGRVENNWDELVIIDTDGSFIVAPTDNFYGAAGNLVGLTYQSTGNTISFYINSDGSGSCQSSSTYTPIDVSVTCATCINPVATYAVRGDCAVGPQFFVDVDITSLGSANSLTVTDNQSSTPQTVTSTGLISFGPYVNAIDVQITVTNDDDINCVRSSDILTQPFCQDFVVDCSAGASTLNYCYDSGGANNPVIFTFTSNDGNSLNMTFNAGQVENNWDELVVIDSDGTFIVAPTANFYGAGGNLAGLTYQSTGDTISFYINSDTSVSCQSSSYTPMDVSVTCATCINPAATYAVRSDCINGPQFLIDVDITSLGSATSLTVTDNQGGAPQTVTSTGTITFGPYPNATNVQITVANDDDVNCVKTSTMLTQALCLENYVDCAVGPVTNTSCYGNNGEVNPEIILFTSLDGTPLNLTFNSGNVEWNAFGNYAWDPLIVLDSDGVTELYNGGGNAGDLSGLTFQSTGGSISYYIESDFVTSCASSTTIAPITVTAACATCINPAATFAVIDDCQNGQQFLIDVNITSMGSADSLTITDNQGSTGVQTSTTGIVQMGPYPFATPIVISIANDQDVNCIINSASIQVAACPPANDNCPGATMAVVNTGPTCDLVTPGTILAATPSGVPAPSCGGNPDDDVWFQFTALHDVELISLVNISGGTSNLYYSVYSGDCGTLTEIFCSDVVANFVPNLVVGTTYFVRVYSFSSIPETTIFDLCIKQAPGNLVCESAVNFCGNNGGLITDSIIGVPSTGAIACLTSVQNPAWNIIQIGQSGLINLQIVQNTAFDSNGVPIGQGLDVDYALWGPFTSLGDACLNLTIGCPTPNDCPGIPYTPEFYPYGNIIDCSWSAAAIETATIDNAIAGEIYVLLVSNYSNQAGTIQIQQTNGGTAGAGSTVAEIQVDLGGDQNTCGASSLVLTADSPFADTYEWYADGFIIDGETGQTLTVTETNTYTVIVYDSQCDSYAQDEVVITIGTAPVANPVADMVACDLTGEGAIAFNLEAQTAIILGSQDPSLINVTYHLSQSDADLGIGALTSPYTNISSPQTIYVRVEDANAPDCYVTTSFDLIISGTTPTATSADMTMCDDATADGFATFVLTSNDANILNGQSNTDYVVSYYASEDDANAGTNALTSPYTNTSNPQTIWARVENVNATSCYAIASFELIVNLNPTVNPAPDLAGCDTDDNEVAEFDLTMNETVINGGEPNVTFTYYTSLADATAPMNAIGNPTDYETNLNAVFVRLDNELTGCFSITSFNLVPGEVPMTSFPSNFNYEVCPNATTPIMITATPQNYTEADVSIVWLRDGGVISGQTGLTLPVLVAGTYSIQVTFNETGCTSTVSQVVIVLDNCIIPQGISPDGDGKNDTFDLSAFNVKRIEIFNRLGTLVYSKDNYTNEWYGQTNKGDQLPVGTYFYTMIYEGGAKQRSAWVYINK